jgi:hypothetical protein
MNDSADDDDFEPTMILRFSACASAKLARAADLILAMNGIEPIEPTLPRARLAPATRLRVGRERPAANAKTVPGQRPRLPLHPRRHRARASRE